MEKIMKNQKDLQLMTSRFSGYKISSEEFLY